MPLFSIVEQGGCGPVGAGFELCLTSSEHENRMGLPVLLVHMQLFTEFCGVHCQKKIRRVRKCRCLHPNEDYMSMR